MGDLVKGIQMVKGIFVIAALIFFVTLWCLLWAALISPDALSNRNNWRTPRVSLSRSTIEQRENSNNFLAWLLVKTSQVSFFVMVIFYFLARI